MFFVKIFENNTIDGIYEGDTLPLNAYEIDESLIGQSDIVKGEFVDLYDTTTWQYKKTKDGTRFGQIVPSTGFLSKNFGDGVKLTRALRRVSINTQKTNIITIGIVCCNKDYQNAIEVIKKINPDSYIEVILVNNSDISITLPEYPTVKIIKNDKNLYPFYSRAQIAKEATGGYLVYLDGDDSFNLDALVNITSLVDNDIILTGIDEIPDNELSIHDIFQIQTVTKFNVSLHNIIFKKSIYKYFTRMPNIPIWYFEDSFYFYYGILLAKSIGTSNESFYDYNTIKGGNLYKINSEEEAINMFQNGDKLIQMITSVFPTKAGSIIKNNYYNGIAYFVDTNFFIKHNKYFLNYISYYSNVYKSKGDLFNKLLPIKPAADKIDIIYIFYGKNIEEEISNLSIVSPNYNLIIIDYLNTVDKPYKNIIKNYNIFEALSSAYLLCETNHILILESYKKLFPVSVLSSKTAVYIDTNTISMDDLPILRNNVIFSKEDFKRFIYTVSPEFGELFISIWSFLNLIDFELIDSPITLPDVFDESDITFFLISFNNLIENDYVSQYCYKNLQEQFPKSTIKLLKEADLKDKINESSLTKDLVNERNSKTLNYENDILRLILLNENPKSIYLDLDAVILDKTAYLKKLSLYPQYCPATYCGPSIVYHNETIWSLGNSSFIKANKDFYDNITKEYLLDNLNSLWNGSVSLEIQNKYGYVDLDTGRLSLGLFGDLNSSNIIRHFCGSRLEIRKAKEPKKLGVIFKKSDTDIQGLNLKNYDDLDYLTVITKGDVTNNSYYHSSVDQFNEVTTIEYFIDQSTMLNLIQKHFNNKYKITDFAKITYKDDPINIIIPELYDRGIPETLQNNIDLWIKKFSKESVNILSLNCLHYYYLSEYSLEELYSLRENNIEKLKKMIKENIVAKSLVDTIYIDITVAPTEKFDINDFQCTSSDTGNIEDASIIFISTNDKTCKKAQYNIINYSNYKYYNLINEKSTVLLPQDLYAGYNNKITSRIPIPVCSSTDQLHEGIRLNWKDDCTIFIQIANELYYFYGYKIFDYIKLQNSLQIEKYIIKNEKGVVLNINNISNNIELINNDSIVRTNTLNESILKLKYNIDYKYFSKFNKCMVILQLEQNIVEELSFASLFYLETGIKVIVNIDKVPADLMLLTNSMIESENLIIE